MSGRRVEFCIGVSERPDLDYSNQHVLDHRRGTGCDAPAMSNSIESAFGVIVDGPPIAVMEKIFPWRR